MKKIYYDNAATTAQKPAEVVRAVKRSLSGIYGNPGRGGHTASLAAADLLYKVREKAANFFGLSEPENVIFCGGATMAINTVLRGILLSGDHVLFSAIEHNAVRRPLCDLAARGVVAETYEVTNGFERLNDDEILKEIRSKVRENTRMIIASHVSNICSAELPIRKIGEFCRQRGILFLVDAAQSAGILSCRMDEVYMDYLCVPGHKGLYGPAGSGLLMIRPGTEIPTPLLSGGSGILSGECTMPEYLPERLEAGTLPLPAIVGLGAGIDYVQQLGCDAIHDHHKKILQRLCSVIDASQGLTRFAKLSPLNETILFVQDGVPSELTAEQLDREGIAVRAGYHCAPLAHAAFSTPEGGAVRISVGLFNNIDECEIFARAIEKIVQ